MASESEDASAEQVAQLRRQREMLCRFGEEALRADDIDTVLQEACRAVSEAIGIRLVKILELLPDERKMLVRAGVGWKPGVVGHVTFDADESSPAGYALMTSDPVISRDLSNETRFEIPDVLREHGVRSMVNVGIALKRGPWGVLEVDSPEGRQFGQDDITFLKNYSNLVAAAIERVQSSQEREEILERNRILLREVQHRVMNLLGNIRALAALTGKDHRDLVDFMAAFDTRLAALERTQRLLTRGSFVDVDLRELLCQELEAHGVLECEGVTIKGPDTAVSPQTARPLAMAFHELATNAVKHGAFSVEGGSLDVAWSVSPSEGGGDLLIQWRETGVPIAGKPKRRSLGRRMLEESTPYMIEGISSLAFHPDGIEYTLRFPRSGAG